MHNSIKIDFEGIALEDGGTIVKDIPYVVGLKNYHFILSNLSLGGVIQNDISVEAVVTLESVIENEGQEDEFTSYHQQIVFKNVYGYDVTIYDKTVTASLVMTPQDVIDEIEAGTLDNAKPIYVHPITIEGTYSTYRIKIALLIFDNSSEEYNTYDKLSAKLNSIFAVNPLAAFPTTGGLFNSANSNLHIAQKIYKDSDDIVRISTLMDDGTVGYFSLSNFSEETFYDGVNKLN